MLALRDHHRSATICAPNVLPCRIHHNGPTKVTKRYWSSTPELDGSKTSYFRGRRLRGRVVKLPESYRGVLAKISDDTLTPSKQPTKSADYDNDECMEDDEEVEEEEAVTLVNTVSIFDELLVWGHDQLPPADDPFVKGIEEHIALAEAIHGPKNERLVLNSGGEGNASNKDAER